jgi:hypothetical protein
LPPLSTIQGWEIREEPYIRDFRPKHFLRVIGMEGAKEEYKIVVAVDESRESMYALSWCLRNLVSHSSKNTLVLLYVKPPPSVSSFDAAGLQLLASPSVWAKGQFSAAPCWCGEYVFDVTGYMFSSDVVSALEKYGSDLVNSVMQRTEAIIRNFGSNVSLDLLIL